MRDKCIITKLPDKIDPNKIMMDEIDKRYRRCPCCGETRFFPTDNVNDGWIVKLYRSWYGKQHEYSPGKAYPNFFLFIPIKYLFEKSRHWRINSYSCTGCGTRWDSIAFPTDILNTEEIQNIYNKIFK